MFAVRAGVPIVIAAVVREPGWPQRYAIHLERIEWSPTGDRESDLLSLTAAHTRALESHVCAYPEQYLWQHKRWRTAKSPQTGTEEPASEAQVLPR